MPIGSLPLHIQTLGSLTEQALVLLHVAQLQAADKTASPNDVRATFVNLRVPPPSNISHYLALLAKADYAMKVSSGQWAVTPLGAKRIRKLMADIDLDQLGHLGQDGIDASFGNAPHHLIPPELAPATFQRGIARFLEGHPFDLNVLCITRFPRHEADPIGPAVEACRDVGAQASLDLHLASDRAVEDLLFGNVAAAMWASRYGIAIFEDRVGEGINYNVSLEVGAMLMTGRRCLLLKDKTVERMPTDLVGHIYQSVDLDDLDAVAATVGHWVAEELGL